MAEIASKLLKLFSWLHTRAFQSEIYKLGDKVKYRKVTFEDIDFLVRRESERVTSVDKIVSLGRGGMVIARILSDELDIKDIELIHYHSYVNNKRIAGYVSGPPPDIRGCSILLCDDISDTGQSFKSCINYLFELGASWVQTFSVHYRKTSLHKPDYYCEEINDEWIVYPWETKEFTGMDFKLDAGSVEKR